MITFKSFIVRLTGFKPRRVLEWRAALKDAGRSVGWYRLARILALDALSRLHAGQRASRSAWRVGMRECGRCPVYNRATKGCFDNLGMNLGCRCYMPMKRIMPGETCWLKQVRGKK